MNTLESAVFLHDGHAVTTSLKVAEVFGKGHHHVLRNIKRLECSDEFRQSNFGLADYLDEQKKLRPMHEITKNGFAFLVMGFTGKQAAEFKEAYIKRFDEMEELLKQEYIQPLAQLGNYWCVRRPHWPLIRPRVLAGERYRDIADSLGLKPSQVSRAVRSMCLTGVLNPLKVAAVQRGPARKAALRYAEQLGLLKPIQQPTQLPLWEPSNT